MTEPVSLGQARRSTLLVTVMLALLAGWQTRRGHQAAVWTLAIMAFATATCLLRPSATLAFHRWWMRLATALGWINSRILLSLVYFGLMTPLGLVRRGVGQDPLSRRSAALPSYWTIRQKTRQTPRDFERAF